jgi:23S rRNA maturation-related 3'-5' exoribonuclease YhaM
MALSALEVIEEEPERFDKLVNKSINNREDYVKTFVSVMQTDRGRHLWDNLDEDEKERVTEIMLKHRGIKDIPTKKQLKKEIRKAKSKPKLNKEWTKEAKPHRWSDKEVEWLSDRYKEKSNINITNDFNSLFKKKRSYWSIFFSFLFQHVFLPLFFSFFVF